MVGPPEDPQAAIKPPRVPPVAEKPDARPMVKVTDPEEKKEKRYSLQVATLVVERNALTLKKRLAGLGYTPLIRKLTAPITSHQVYGGEFDTREEADKRARRLDIDDFPSKVVETGGWQIRLEVGSYFDQNKAIDLAHRLQKKNYTTKIVSEASPIIVHVVRVGEYPTREEALKALMTLKRGGFAPILVMQ